jgi:hypothetical protein
MKEDTTLEQLFAGFQPPMGDKEAYMKELARKLAAVEYVRQYNEARIRRYKRVVFWAFLLGSIIGALLVILAICIPADVPTVTFNMDMGLLYYLTHHYQLMLLVIVSLLFSSGAVALLNMETR